MLGLIHAPWHGTERKLNDEEDEERGGHAAKEEGETVSNTARVRNSECEMTNAVAQPTTRTCTAWSYDKAECIPLWGGWLWGRVDWDGGKVPHNGWQDAWMLKQCVHVRWSIEQQAKLKLLIKMSFFQSNLSKHWFMMSRSSPQLVNRQEINFPSRLLSSSVNIFISK